MKYHFNNIMPREEALELTEYKYPDVSNSKQKEIAKCIARGWDESFLFKYDYNASQMRELIYAKRLIPI